MGSPETCQEVVLIHGTFAGDKSPNGGRWWQQESFFWNWLNERLPGRVACSKTFHWSGRNRERDRRKAGQDLYERLAENERLGRTYHLVGHSHGGSVIWNALRIAARRKQPLEGLKSWTTVGTPFFAFRPQRGELLFLIPLVVALAFAPRVVAQMVISAQSFPAMWEAGDSWPFLDLAALWAVWWFALYISAFRVGALAWGTVTRWSEQKSDVEAFCRFGPRWEGIWSPEDEAIRGLQSTVAVDLRDLKDSEGKPLRIIPPSRLFLFLPGISTLGDRLVFEWLRRFLQGNDRVSLKIDAVSPGPLPWAEAEPLPDEIHQKLVRRVTEGVDFYKTFERLRRLLGIVAFGGPFSSPFRDEAGRPSIFNSILIHTLYLPEQADPADQGSAPLIAEQVARHIARRAIGPAPEPYPRPVAPSASSALRPERERAPFRRLYASTAVQRAWTYALLAVLFLMAMASDARFDRVRVYTPEYQVSEVLNDPSEDNLGAVPGEIAGADRGLLIDDRPGGAGERALADWCRSLFAASAAEPEARTRWRSLAILPPMKVGLGRAEAAVARIEDPNTRANALAAIAESLRDAGQTGLVRVLARKAHDEAALVHDRADRVATFARIAGLYPRGDPEGMGQAREAVEVAMAWLQERGSFQAVRESLRTGPANRPANVDENKPRENVPPASSPPGGSAATGPDQARTSPRAQMVSLLQSPIPAQVAPRKPPQATQATPSRAGQKPLMPAKQGPPDQPQLPNAPAPQEPAGQAAFASPASGPGALPQQPSLVAASSDLNLTPSNAQQMILGVLRSIEILDEGDREAAREAAQNLGENLIRIDRTPNQSSGGVPSKGEFLRVRKISVLELSQPTLIRLAALDRRLGLSGSEFELKLRALEQMTWASTPAYAEEADELLANAAGLQAIGRAESVRIFAESALKAPMPDSSPVGSAALADDLVRAGNLLIAIDHEPLAEKTIARARQLIGKIAPSPTLIEQRNWVQLEDLRDNRQKIIDRYTLFRVRIRIALANQLWELGSWSEASSLLRDAWDDALTVGTMQVKDGSRVDGSRGGPDRRVEALAEVIASEARINFNETALCLRWIADLRKADESFSDRLLRSEQGARALRQVATSVLRQNKPDEALAIARLLSSDALRYATHLDVADFYAFRTPGSKGIKDPAKARPILEAIGSGWERVPRRRDRSLLASRVATLWAHLGDLRKARLASEKCLPEDRLPAYASILDSAFVSKSDRPTVSKPLSLVGAPESVPKPRPALDPRERTLAFLGILPDDAVPNPRPMNVAPTR